MKLQTKMLSILLMLTMMLGLTACASSSSEPNSSNTSKPPAEGKANASASSSQTTKSDTQPEKTKGIKVKVTVGQQILTATLIDNATTRSLIAKFPLTVPMMNLYARELVYRFPDPLPANEEQTSGYEIGDISYWTPRHSFVFFYKQNGEVISNLQKIGRFDSNVEVLGQVREADVKLELLE